MKKIASFDVSKTGFQSLSVMGGTPVEIAFRTANDGADYLQAAITLEGADKNKPGLMKPAYMLVGHSIELSLKSFLYNAGVAEKEIAGDIGHDLKRALERARQLGLQFKHPHLDRTIDELGPLVRDHVLRYPKSGMWSAPLLKDVRDAAEALNRHVFDIVMPALIAEAEAAKKAASAS